MGSRAASMAAMLWAVEGWYSLTDEPLPIGDGDVGNVVFSPDSKTLAAGYGGDPINSRGGVITWDLTHPEQLSNRLLAVPEGLVQCVAFSADGKSMAAEYHNVKTGSGMVLWEVERWERLAAEPLVLAKGSILSVAFLPNGKTLALGYNHENDNGLALWNVDLDSWQSLARRIANRNLTRDEWRQYFVGLPYRATFGNLPSPPPDRSINPVGLRLRKENK